MQWLTKLLKQVKNDIKIIAIGNHTKNDMIFDYMFLNVFLCLMSGISAETHVFLYDME